MFQERILVAASEDRVTAARANVDLIAPSEKDLARGARNARRRRAQGGGQARRAPIRDGGERMRAA